MKQNKFIFVVLTLAVVQTALASPDNSRMLYGNMATSLNDSNSECLKVVGEPECINVQMASFNMDEVKKSGDTPPSSTFPILDKNTILVVPGHLEEKE